MALEHIVAVSGYYKHPQSSHRVEVSKFLSDLAGSKGIARERKEATLYAETAVLDKAFDFATNGIKTFRGGNYEIITSPRHPLTAMVRYTITGSAPHKAVVNDYDVPEGVSSVKFSHHIDGYEPHRIVFIKRPEGVEYYNPNGTPYEALPIGLKQILYRDLDFGKHMTQTTTLTPTTSLLINHQGRFPVCADCSIVRSVLSHETNETYDTGMSTDKGRAKAPVEKVMGIKAETLKKGVIQKEEVKVEAGKPIDPMKKAQIEGLKLSSTNLKKGGMVKGKKGQAVPIVAHAGELVVPAHVVPSVLKSSAWIEHVMKVKKEHSVSYKEAMKIAKGSYKTNK